MNDYAKSEALKLLLSKKRTEKELIDLLVTRKGVSYEEACVAASYYRENGYIDHMDYARRFIHDYVHIKEYGPYRIKASLSQKGIEEDIIDTVLREYAFDVLPIMERRFGRGTKNEKEQNRIFQYFCRKGFASSHIREAMDALYTYE